MCLRRGWVVVLAVTLIAWMLVLCTDRLWANTGPPPPPPNPPTDCRICVSDSCEENFTSELQLVGSMVVLRCVEYDHIPPAHCADVREYQFNYVAGPNLGGNCFKCPCGNGVPHPDIPCTNAWTSLSTPASATCGDH